MIIKYAQENVSARILFNTELVVKSKTHFMKKLLFPFVITVLVTMAACSSQGAKSVDPVLEAAVRAKIESKDYTVYVDRMTARRGRTVTLSHPWNIRISGDSIYSYLPYFGEAYTPVMGRQDGLNFDGKVTDYKVKEGKKGAIDIEFSARTFEDRYDYRLEVYPNGNSYLTVTPDRKSSITFDGRLRLDE